MSEIIPKRFSINYSDEDVEFKVFSDEYKKGYDAGYNDGYEEVEFEEAKFGTVSDEYKKGYDDGYNPGYNAGIFVRFLEFKSGD